MKLEHVSYSYDKNSPFEVKALDDITLEIPQGSFMGIVGTTGSGKSTLAKILKGLIKPDSGTVVSEPRKVGLVFQYPEIQLFEETVLKDIEFGPLNLGMTLEKARECSVKAMELVGLDAVISNRNPLMLSGGEKRKVAVAGILSMDPEVLILDEPSAGLDSASHDQLFELLEKLNKDNKTIIIISHDMDDIARYCRIAVVLEKGKVVAQGEPEQLPQCKSTIKILEEKLKAQNLL